MGTRETREMWSDYRCTPNSLSAPIYLFERYAGRVAAPAYYPFMALGLTLERTGYTNVQSVWIPRPCPTGISGHTCEPDGDWCSLHNYLIAVDIDPYGYGNNHFKKPFGDGWNFADCKITADQVRAVESIRNTQGERMFRWLGWLIGDTMHFEIQVAPDRCQVDWDTVPNDTGDDDMPYLPMESGDGYETPPAGSRATGDRSHKIEDVRSLQDMLNNAYSAGLTLDGLYGPATISAVKKWVGRYTGNPAGQQGEWFGGNQYGNLIADLALKQVGGGGEGSYTKQESDDRFAKKTHPHVGIVTENTEVEIT